MCVKYLKYRNQGFWIHKITNRDCFDIWFSVCKSSVKYLLGNNKG